MQEIVNNLRLWDILDILFVAFIIYRIILLIKGTRAVQMLIGLVVVLGLYIISFRIGFFTLCLYGCKYLYGDRFGPCSRASSAYV